MPTSTPWGAAQTSQRYGYGVTRYTTAGHGGFRVSPTVNAKVPDHLRIEDGWYEEDCEWARVPLAFPELFTNDDLEAAKRTLRTWAPDAYEAHFGVTLRPGESVVKDERAFHEEHRDDLLVTTAWGDWHDAVPAGFVGVVARRGDQERHFLVPKAEYDADRQFSFIVDPARHAPWAANHLQSKAIR